MWIVKAYPKSILYRDGRPLCSWHTNRKDAEESAKMCRTKRVFRKIIIEKIEGEAKDHEL